MKNTIKMLMIGAGVALLTGCSSNGECVESHVENQLVWLPQSNGQFRLTVMPKTVCDKYADVEDKVGE